MLGNKKGLPDLAKLQTRVAALESELDVASALQREAARKFDAARGAARQSTSVEPVFNPKADFGRLRANMDKANLARVKISEALEPLRALAIPLRDLIAAREALAKVLPDGTSEAELLARLESLSARKLASDDLVRTANGSWERANFSSRSGGEEVPTDVRDARFRAARELGMERDSVWRQYGEALDAVVAARQHRELVVALEPRVKQLTSALKGAS